MEEAAKSCNASTSINTSNNSGSDRTFRKHRNGKRIKKSSMPKCRDVFFFLFGLFVASFFFANRASDGQQSRQKTERMPCSCPSQPPLQSPRPPSCEHVSAQKMSLRVESSLEHAINGTRYAVSSPLHSSPPPSTSWSPVFSFTSPFSREDDSNLWLLIGINTVPRSKDQPYLRKILAELASQIPRARGSLEDPLAGRVVVMVQNLATSRSEHPVFLEAEKKYMADERFIFIDRFGTLSSSSTTSHIVSGQRRLLTATRPVQRQTRDVVLLLRTVLRRFAVPTTTTTTTRWSAKRRTFSYYLFMEDDFLPCHNALLGLWYLLHRANENHGLHGWAALRASYGLNGIIIRAENVEAITNHLSNGAQRRPPDHLFFEWTEKWASRRHKSHTESLSGGNNVRSVVAFRHNLFFHLGTSSVVGNSANRFVPACYELLYDWLQADERFSVEECAHDAVTPCKPPPSSPPLGHGLSVPKKGGNGFPCSISLQDEPMLFSSARYRSCADPKLLLQQKPLSQKQPERTARAQTIAFDSKDSLTNEANFNQKISQNNINAMKQRPIIPTLAARGENCFSACGKLTGVRVLNNCDGYAFESLNNCGALMRVIGSNKCSAGCFESHGADQPAIEVMPGGQKANAIGVKCLVNRVISSASCFTSHPRTRRLCPCAHQDNPEASLARRIPARIP